MYATRASPLDCRLLAGNQSGSCKHQRCPPPKSRLSGSATSGCRWRSNSAGSSTPSASTSIAHASTHCARATTTRRKLSARNSPTASQLALHRRSPKHCAPATSSSSPCPRRSTTRKRPDLSPLLQGQRSHRPRAQARRHRRLRIDRLSRRHRGNLRAGAREGLRPALQRRISPSATARSASIPATSSTA